MNVYRFDIDGKHQKIAVSNHPIRLNDMLKILYRTHMLSNLDVVVLNKSGQQMSLSDLLYPTIRYQIRTRAPHLWNSCMNPLKGKHMEGPINGFIAYNIRVENESGQRFFKTLAFFGEDHSEMSCTADDPNQSRR